MIGGLNYQVEHHLFPYISHIHYRAISPIVKQTALEFGVRYNENKTFFGAISSHVRMLKKLGHQQYILPNLPPVIRVFKNKTGTKRLRFVPVLPDLI